MQDRPGTILCIEEKQEPYSIPAFLLNNDLGYTLDMCNLWKHINIEA